MHSPLLRCIMLCEYTKFYYHALPDHKKKIYKALYEGFKNRVKAVDIRTDRSVVSIQEVQEIAMSVYNDTPSFYYLDISQYFWAPTMFGYSYSQEYIYTDEEIRGFDRQLEAGLQKFKSKYIRPGMTDYEKEKQIHDYLVSTIEYDHSIEDQTASRVDEAFNVLGALIKKKAVCHGISCAFKLLCDYCDLKSMVVVGDSIPSLGYCGHAWNMVKLNEETYHVDVTWDIKEKGDISCNYDYFNMDGKLMGLDHTWDRSLYPVCNSIEHNYYYKNDLFVKSLNELTDFVAKRLSSGQKYIAVKFAAPMPSEYQVSMAVRNAFYKSMTFSPYYFRMGEKSHNIYVEL